MNPTHLLENLIKNPDGKLPITLHGDLAFPKQPYSLSLHCLQVLILTLHTPPKTTLFPQRMARLCGKVIQNPQQMALDLQTKYPSTFANSTLIILC